MLTQEQARIWAEVDPTLRFTCPAGRCFSSIGPITDCVHAREAARGRAFGGVVKDGGGRGVGVRTGADGRPGLILNDGPAEYDAAEAATVRAMTRRNQERHFGVR